MAKDTGGSGSSQNAVNQVVSAVGGSIGTKPKGAPTSQTSDPTDTGLRGKARLAADLARNNGAPDTNEYDQYIFNLKTDPSDAEYSRELLMEKARAYSRKRARDAEVHPHLYAMTPADIARNKGEPATPEPWSPPPTVDDQGKPVQSAIDLQKKIDEENSKYMTGRRDDNQDNYRRKMNSRPIIEGLPASVEEILSGVQGGTTDTGGILDQWARGKEILGQVEGVQGVEASRQLVATGEYVYVGEVADPQGGEGYTRAKYVYKDDAMAQVTNMSEDEIKSYQEQLGLEVTGLVDPDLAGLWEKAVETGQIYARTGKKVDLRFIFDTLVKNSVANGGLGRHGGGGARAMSDTDYYFSMMQVLGDISGVKS